MSRSVVENMKLVDGRTNKDVGDGVYLLTHGYLEAMMVPETDRKKLSYTYYRQTHYI